VASEEITDLLSVQLKNIWIFTLSVSVEFRKPNNITLTQRKNLDNQITTFWDLDFSNIEVFGRDEVTPAVAAENEWAYSENFKKLYYNRLSESYIYYDELYSLITSGKQIDNYKFKQSVEEGFKVKEGKINPAHKILNSFLHQGYWTYSNEEFVKSLNQLLELCEKGQLEDVVSYLNAGVYLLGFNELFGIDKDTITNKIKEGLAIYLPQVNFNHLSKSQFEMVQSNFYPNSWNT
jgi:hypothetical protein